MVISRAPSRSPEWEFRKMLSSMKLRVPPTQKGTTNIRFISFGGSEGYPGGSYIHSYTALHSSIGGLLCSLNITANNMYLFPNRVSDFQRGPADTRIHKGTRWCTHIHNDIVFYSVFDLQPTVKFQTKVGLLILLSSWLAGCQLAVTHFLLNPANIPFVSFLKYFGSRVHFVNVFFESELRSAQGPFSNLSLGFGSGLGSARCG